MKFYGITDKGLVRKNNQDSYVIARNEDDDLLAIVADGIGGNLGGDVASRMAVAHFSGAFADSNGFTDAATVKEWIEENVHQCNEKIFNYGQSHAKMKGMGTTLCAVMITRVCRFVINIGDSRAYAWFPDGRFQQLTIDHTLVNDMIMHGQLSREEAVDYPKKNVLTNALGVWKTVRCDIDTHLEKISGFMLCSDGLHGYVDDNTIQDIVLNHRYDPALRVRKLMKQAKAAGGFDNVTVILIDLEGDGLV